MNDYKKLSKEEFGREVKRLREELKSFMWDDNVKSKK